MSPLLTALGINGGPGIFGGLGKPKGDGLPPGFPQTIRAADLMDTTTPTDITLVNGSFVQLGNGFTVPAQRAYRWGYGTAALPANQGYIFVSIIDDTAGDATQEDGTLRILVSDANGLSRRVVAEYETEELDGAAQDKQLRIALPEQGPLAREDDLLLIELRARAVDIVQPDFSTVRLPVTLYQPVGR